MRLSERLLLINLNHKGFPFELQYNKMQLCQSNTLDLLRIVTKTKASAQRPPSVSTESAIEMQPQRQSIKSRATQTTQTPFANPSNAPPKRTTTKKKKRSPRHRTSDGAMDGGAVLELDRYRLVVQLHQEPAPEFGGRNRTGNEPVNHKKRRKKNKSGKGRAKREPRIT